MLESLVEASNLIPAVVAQVNLANNRSKAQLIDRLISKYTKIIISHIDIVERCDKTNIISKYVSPLTMSSNKIQSEASSNPKLKEALSRL